MKYIIVIFMCIGMCLVGGNNWGGNRGVRGVRKDTSTAMTNPRSFFKEEKDYFARVVQLPSVFHRCNAFFVTNDILIAPATCVLCHEVCEFNVALDSVSVRSPSKFVAVKKIVVHPNFIESYAFGNPSNNIAILKLAESLPDIEPLKISKHVQFKEGFIRSWNFNEEMTDFLLRAHAVKRVTHYICEEYGVSVKVDEICVHGLRPTELGPFNEGSAFVIEDSDPDFPPSAVAIFAKGNTATSGFFPFISISYYYEWLNSTITELSVLK